MECPKCGVVNESKVLGTKYTGPLNSIRRRRECLKCGERWTTYELRDDQISFDEEDTFND